MASLLFVFRINFFFFRVFRELKMMRFFKHENVLSCLDILQVHIFGEERSSSITQFNIYILTQLVLLYGGQLPSQY